MDGAAFDPELTFKEVLTYQATTNPLFGQWLKSLQIDVPAVADIRQIPFLPVELFKNHQIISGDQEAEMIFQSSGTTGQHRSEHHVTDLSLYHTSFTNGFEYFYGDVRNYRILCLLPSYHESGHSSLIYMCHHLMQASAHPDNGFYHGRENLLLEKLYGGDMNTHTLLIGVSYALLDLAKLCSQPLVNTIIMETGGMKGRRKELLRIELHQLLCDGFGVSQIHSEYGMTELLSQAYSSGSGLFRCPPWMKVWARNADDPFDVLPYGKSGLLNVYDLANINSCCFIATQDTGKVYADGTFEVTGRSDNSDLRGCNLLIS
jgi:hypothetical protein